MQPAAQFSNFIPAKEAISSQGLKKPPLRLSGEKKNGIHAMEILLSL